MAQISSHEPIAFRTGSDVGAIPPLNKYARDAATGTWSRKARRSASVSVELDLMSPRGYGFHAPWAQSEEFSAGIDPRTHVHDRGASSPDGAPSCPCLNERLHQTVEALS